MSLLHEAFFVSYFHPPLHPNTASATHRQARVTNYLIINSRRRSSLPSTIIQLMSRLPVNMSLIWAVSMWLLVTYVLIASASLSDRTALLCARQHPTQLRFQEHQEHFQETFFAIHSISPTPLLAAASDLSSHQIVDNRTVFESFNRLATRTNTTQLADNLRNLDLAKETGDSGETSTEEQHNDTSNKPNEERCPSGFDTLDCEDCGGPEHTWELAHNAYHCIGVSKCVTHNHRQC
jgi:hypothetical protein